jgi:zinc/manganese transport system substrate-binding protein
MPHARTALALTALGTLVLTGCSDSGSASSGAAVRSGDADACPGEVVDVAVSVGQWSDLVERLGGACATVTTVVASSAVDPHSFEPDTADIAAFSGADLVVVNGAGYDGWAEAAVENLDPAPALVDVAEVAGLEGDEHAEETHAEGGHSEDDGHGAADPHLWYEPDVLPEVAAAVTEELRALSPDAAGYFDEQAAAWAEELQPYLDAVESLRAEADGRTYAATETVFDRTAAALGLEDVTPEGYRRAAGNESEPAPGDLTAFEAALADGSVDVLVYNAQTRGSIPEQLRAAAEDAGVPVVEVTESPTDADGSFVAWQLAQLSALTDALDATP